MPPTTSRKVTASTGIITSIAGVGNGTTAGSFSGDGGPATAANLNNPDGIAIDVSGNVYFSDQGNSRIRRIDATTGIITTIAGFSNPGYTGDNVPATASGLYFPGGIKFDAAGDLYIADWSDNRIRKITMSTGIITTVAGTGTSGYAGNGGPATAAEFSLPSDIAFDPSGNMYVSEYGNSVVRKITAATGIITTAAGTGGTGYVTDGVPANTTEVYEPLAITTDASGNLYIADWKNFRVRMVSASTGIISTIAGTGTNGNSGDFGPATAAQMGEVDGIAIDAGGNVYVSDEDHGTIRKITCPTCPLGVPAMSNTHILSIYPNPATTLLTITASENINTITISDLIGQTVYSHDYSASQVQIDIASLSAGVYFVKVNGTDVRKFVKE